MKRLLLFLVVSFATVSLAALNPQARNSKRTTDKRVAVISQPRGVSDRPLDSVRKSSYAFNDTVVLAEFTFDNGGPDPQGWVSVDRTAPIDTFFHVDGVTGAMDGGDFGRLTPLEGNQSLWCGVDARGEPPYSGWATLPGYGDRWSQRFESAAFPVNGDVTVRYKVAWDTEPTYDVGHFEYDDVSTGWTSLRTYDGIGQASETVVIPSSNHGGTLRLRFVFDSDGGFSDEDGNRDSDGAMIIDSLVISDIGGQVDFQDFESEAVGALTTSDGDWRAAVPAGFGDYAALHDGFSVLQEDPCAGNVSAVWGFFDEAASTNYGCGGHPEQGAVPLGPDSAGFYIENEIWSPPIPLSGTGSDVRLQFDVYRDLPDGMNLFYTWAVRSWVGGVPGLWKSPSLSLHYGDQKDWFEADFGMGALIESGADSIQVALGVVDLSWFWGGGTCHSHSPLFDNVRVVRIEDTGPVWAVLDRHLFHDNFAVDGTGTGFARLDMAEYSVDEVAPVVVFGDSIVVQVSDGQNGLGTDVAHGGEAVYCYVFVASDTVKAGASIQSPDDQRYFGDPAAGIVRYPWVTDVGIGGDTWSQFRMDNVYRWTGAVVADEFCFDLMDIRDFIHLKENQTGNVGAFTPGDTVFYFFGAKNTLDQWTYWSRSGGTTDQMAEAATAAMEMTCLPANALNGRTRILYVDHYDNLGAQPYFDEAFRALGINPDRYDVLSRYLDNNGLDSRVLDVTQQVLPYYDVIIWNSGDLATGLDNDISNDYRFLLNFFAYADTNVGLYISGDNIAEDWSSLGGLAGDLRNNFMNFSLVSGDHLQSGLPPTPSATGQNGSIFYHGVADTWLSAGDCPAPARFDVLTANAPATEAAAYLNLAGSGAVLTQETQNAQAAWARVVLSGASFHKIRDVDPGVPARIEHLRDILNWFEQGVAYSAACQVEPITIDFDTVAVWAQVDSMFTITNTGLSTLSGTVTSTCEHYSVLSGASYSLGPGEVDTVVVRYSPPSAARHICTIETGLSECPDVTCTGVGTIDPLCDVVPDSLFFGDVAVGASADSSFTIHNVGFGVISDSVAVSCSHYSVIAGGGPYALVPGDSLVVTVRFEPTVEGTHVCVIDAGSAACGGVVTTGIGSPWGSIPPTCTVSPSSVHFGRNAVGATRDTTFTITNTGGGTLDGNASEPCSLYSITSGAGPFSLAHDESHVVGIRYAPTAAGEHKCLIETNSNGFGRLVLVADGASGVQVLHAEDPAAPVFTGTYDTAGDAQNIFVAGSYAYVADGSSGLQMIDISDPTSPTLLGTYNTPGGAEGVTVSGDYAFVADGAPGLHVIDVSNPASPTLLGTYNTPGVAWGVTVSGDYAYVADLSSGLQVIDISDPANPTLVGAYDTPSFARDVAVSGDYAFVADASSGLQVIDISDPASPTLLGTYNTPGQAYSVVVSGDYAFVADWNPGLQVIDISVPTSPTLLGAYNTPGYAEDVTVSGDYAFVADGTSGLQVIDVSDPTNPGQVGTYNSPGDAQGVAVTPGSDVACTGYAGYEYALIDSIVDVPNDQGGQVRINLTRSIYDFAEETQLPIVAYQVWRRVDAPAAIAAPGSDPGDDRSGGIQKPEKSRPVSVSDVESSRPELPGWPLIEQDGRYFLRSPSESLGDVFPPGTWEYVHNVNTTQQQNYIIFTSTLADSSQSGIPYSVYVVTAHTTTPAIWFTSPPDSGYSVDNIAPGVPQAFVVAYNTGSGNQLSWDPAPEPDFQYYRVFRGSDESFTPDSTNAVHETATLGWTDPDYDGGTVHYKVSAVDDVGNESEAAGPGTVTATNEPAIPDMFALYQNVPNPFNPTTVIRYDVPAGGGRVTLKIYDVAGRLVRTLVDGVEASGEKRVTWYGRNNRGSRVATGVYFYRMTGPGFTKTRKMVLLQ